MKYIDKFLNDLTMYRLVSGGLSLLAVVSIIFAATDAIALDPIYMILTLVVAVAVPIIASLGFEKLFNSTTTSGSPMITGLILFFIFRPANEVEDFVMLAVIGVIAAASKYIVAWDKRHIFNPAAFAAMVSGYIGFGYADWWIANEPMAIFVAIFGFLILRKLHRFALFLSFAGAALVAYLISIIGLGSLFDDPEKIWDTVYFGLTSAPILFLGTVMLTEPMTVPASRINQMIYGVIVGALLGSSIKFAGFFMTPEIALLLGNLFVFVMYSQKTIRMKLVEAKEMGPNIFSYTFKPDRKPAFIAGQYLDITIPGVKYDNRGNRRSFSFASGPHNDNIVLGIKHNEPSSKFKERMKQLRPGDSVFGHHVSGRFVLPKDKNEKIVLIAGGIGVTPFISMLEELVDTDSERDIVFFYQVRTPEEIVFKSSVKESLQHGVKFVPVVGEAGKGYKGETGFIDAEMLGRNAKDFKDRRFYISGPPPMVSSYKKMLKQAGVSSSKIETDYFSGY